jgi:hypothetical protein
MEREYPTERPIDAASVDGAARETVPPELANVPWIDVHNHAHTLSWNERERFSLSGCRGMVMMAAAYYWTPYQPTTPADVRYLWDDALNRLGPIRESHVFDVSLGIGIHAGKRVADAGDLLDVMPEYCALEEVAAVGEIGLIPAQHAERWSLDEQKRVMRRQLEVAADHDLPAVVHTPPDIANVDSVDVPYRRRGSIPGYELDTSLGQEPALDAEDVKLAATELDVDLKDEAGLADDRLVLSHADERIAPYVMENTDCYLSFTVSYPWLLGTTPRDVAAVIEEYGPDRILVETDSAGILRSDVFSFKRTMFELYRLGIDVETIEQVVYENPRDLLD